MTMGINVSGGSYPYSGYISLHSNGDGSTNNGGISCYSGRVTLAASDLINLFTASQITAKAFIVTALSTDENAWASTIMYKRRTSTVGVNNGVYQSSTMYYQNVLATITGVSNSSDHIIRLTNTDTVNSRTFNWWVLPMIRV